MLDSRHLQASWRNIHDGLQIVSDAALRDRTRIYRRELRYTRYSDATFSRIRLVHPRRSCRCLCPPRPVPYEGVEVAEIVETVVVVFLQEGHGSTAECWICFVRSSFGAVVRHEHDERVIELVNLLEVVNDLAYIVVDALIVVLVPLLESIPVGELTSTIPA